MKSRVPANHSTVLVSCMLNEGLVDPDDVTKEEEVLITRVGQLHHSLDQLEEQVKVKEGFLADILKIPEEQLQYWKDCSKVIQLKENPSRENSLKATVMPWRQV